MTAETTTGDGIVLTDAAASKVKALLEAEGREDLTLRIAVQPGGCSGLRYQLFFDDRSLDGDFTKDFGGVGVVTVGRRRESDVRGGGVALFEAALDLDDGLV